MLENKTKFPKNETKEETWKGFIPEWMMKFDFWRLSFYKCVLNVRKLKQVQW